MSNNQRTHKTKHSPKHVSPSKSIKNNKQKNQNSNKEQKLSSKEITEKVNEINQKHEDLKTKMEQGPSADKISQKTESQQPQHTNINNKNVEDTKNIIEEQKKKDEQRAREKKHKERKQALEDKQNKEKIRKRLIISAGCVAAVYLLGVLFFTIFNYPRTIIADTDLSFHTIQATETALEKNSQEYELEIDGLDFSANIPGDTIDYHCDINQVTNRLQKYKNPFLWPYEIFIVHDFQDQYIADFNEAEIDRIATEKITAHNQAAVLPQNAGFKYDKLTKTASIKDEVVGNAINLQTAIASIKSHIGAASRHLTLSENEQILPTVFSSDERINGALTSANTMIKTVLSLKMDQAIVGTVDFDLITTLLSITNDYKVDISQLELSAWVEQLADKCDTLGKTRTYVAPYGKTVTVNGGSTYGWKIDQNALTAQITQQIPSGATTTMSVPCSSSWTAYLGPGQRDWGARYIDIDLSQQHARMYNDAGALIWESAIVSGLPEKPTPTGIYKINQKASPTTLIGQPLPGHTEPEYRTEVTYWMPFVGNSVGLHDAAWQSSFGGSRWLTSGSHGCVNLPVSAAASLYSICTTGDVVVCHN